MSVPEKNPPLLPSVTRSTSPEEIVQLSDQVGAVIIRNFMTPEQVKRINQEVDAPLKALDAGSKHEHELIVEFHGRQTKRLTNLVTHSKTFREEILDDDLFHELGRVLYQSDAGDWWLTTAQLIEIGPGNKAQMLHRDMAQYYPYVAMNKHAPRAIANLMLALTDFTEENGATRLIPGSQDWDDFGNVGTPEMTIPAVLNAGDAVLFGGKVVHGGGANVTAGEFRRGLTIPLQASILTPEEAYPLIVPLEVVRTLSARVQKIIGFRSQYPAGSPGLWQHNYADLADHLQL
ncbi:phytanoyl-CoA dioxygenase family protein [Pseudomonas soli]|jgi:ectoine hydroxylase-related dioxygenase (phytanoyl-CoA dioxygenase family)|nr:MULTISPECIES: phytanoyl-CoA dioxygenase family protein [Pseudomonas]AIN58232.1 phytanoyl-CoA dioxygenase [Pseudomonas soli]AUY32323.1 phytanoyl-CoA dioxygenase family protein [Pseudomonas sp. PONIH3]MCX5506838.1 phytanoyl-CoA dioxygenase family protein [Pseudomonas sp. BJa3]MDT3712408.1 phytanoyl-CoA dioxygenase family protein [Pseudomonas soli]MDT3729745.1 phytanoyl-CoA dioxygenase family protein [Pseudomonas soli]